MKNIFRIIIISIIFSIVGMNLTGFKCNEVVNDAVEVYEEDNEFVDEEQIDEKTELSILHCNIMEILKTCPYNCRAHFTLCDDDIKVQSFDINAKDTICIIMDIRTHTYCIKKYGKILGDGLFDVSKTDILFEPDDSTSQINIDDMMKYLGALLTDKHQERILFRVGYIEEEEMKSVEYKQ